MEQRLALFIVTTLQLCAIITAQGPVYEGGAPKPAVAAPVNSNLITQTVYGFLDFTTTIGNTIMIFSPHSAPPPEQPKTEKSIQENIIETKPPPVTGGTSPKPENIRPTKISADSNKNTEKSEGKPSSSKSDLVKTSLPEKQKESVKKEVVNSSVKPKQLDSKQIITKVEIVTGPSKIVENHPLKVKQNVPQKPKENMTKLSNSVVSSKVQNKPGTQSSATPKFSSIVEIVSSVEEPAILVTNNNIGEPEYDFLSRQPSEFVEETYKVINLRPSKSHSLKPKHASKNRIHQPTQPPPKEDEDHPVGLVTTLGGTIVKDGATTVHETSVIGTYISGKYAQVLQSNSKVFQASGHKQKIAASPTLRILKTAAPAITKNHKYNLEPTPAAIINEDASSLDSISKTTRRQAGIGGNIKNRFRAHNHAEDENENAASQSKKNKNRNTSQSQRPYSNRFGRASNTPQLATVSVFSETPSPSFSNRRKTSRNSGHSKSTVTPASNNDNHSRRGFKPRVQPSSVEQVTPAASTSLYKFKLNRTPGRWQYKTTPKPRVTIRKMMGEDDPQTTPSSYAAQDDPQSNDVSPIARSDNDLELSGSQNGPGSLLDNDAEDNSIEKLPPVETLRVHISTPADFKDVYYEIATIKSPYTFQVGRVKNTRIITVTSTIARSIEPTISPIQPSAVNEPLTENILATASPYGKDHNLLDSSIATLPPITLASDLETPPLETVTETFSTTQHMLKTHILPIVRDANVTSSLTLIQTYHVTRLVTATKTLPPMDLYQFIPSKTLKEFNSRLDEAGSELHLELDFGDSNEDEDGVPSRAFLSDLDLANIGSDFDLSEVDKYRLPDNHLRLKKAHGQNSPKAQQVTESPNPPTPGLTPEQAQQLALLRLLNPAAAAQIPNVVTTSKPILKFETVYESHIIPVFDGKQTIQSTISRPVATITKTEYEIGTSTLQALPLQPLNPLFPQQFQLTSTPVIQHTEFTATESQVLKLTFGAKTVFTTLYSTKVVPTVLTTYVTQSLPVQPSAQFPGYFPGPGGYPFPYVG